LENLLEPVDHGRKRKKREPVNILPHVPKKQAKQKTPSAGPPTAEKKKQKDVAKIKSALAAGEGGKGFGSGPTGGRRGGGRQNTERWANRQGRLDDEAAMVSGMSDEAKRFLEMSVVRAKGDPGSLAVSRGLIPVDSPVIDFNGRACPHGSVFHLEAAIGFCVQLIRNHPSSQIDDRVPTQRQLPTVNEFCPREDGDPLGELCDHLAGLAGPPSFQQVRFLERLASVVERDDRIRVKKALLRVAMRRLSEDPRPQLGLENHREAKISAAEVKLLRGLRLSGHLIAGLEMEESVESMVSRAVGDDPRCSVMFLSAFLSLTVSRTWGGLSKREANVA
jgi:hypothetical protein